MPSGSPWTMGPNGEIIEYVIANGQVAQWNSSNIWNWNVEVGGGAPSAAPSSSFSVASPFGGPPTVYTNTVNVGAGQHVRLYRRERCAERYITNKPP